MENASSSSAAAMTAGAVVRSEDSFSSIANVVPEVMLFPSRLGGLVPSSELESARWELSSDGVWLFSPFLLDLSVVVEPSPLTTRLGVLVCNFRSFSPSTTLS